MAGIINKNCFRDNFNTHSKHSGNTAACKAFSRSKYSSADARNKRMLETQLVNTKEKPFEPTKPTSVRSISLLRVWQEGFNHCLLAIGSITQRLHQGPRPLLRGQRSKCSYNNAQCFIDRTGGAKCFYRCGLVCTKMSFLVQGNKSWEIMSLQMCSSHRGLSTLWLCSGITLVWTYFSIALCVSVFK